MTVNFKTDGDLHRQFNRYLIDLIAQKSVFLSDAGIVQALSYCFEVLKRIAPERNTFYDASGNLISISNKFDVHRNAVFLSAHIDTVDARSSEWVSSSDPFTPMETSTHIIGRGANDCKAGVALTLLLGHLKDKLDLSNVVFLLSFREEGNRGKTSSTIGASLGHAIPLSYRKNLVLCLENTTKPQDGCHIEVYDCEPCNAFISLIDYLPRIRSFLSLHPKWKPVSIQPLVAVPAVEAVQYHSGISGHAATIPNQANEIYKALFNNEVALISGGDAVQTSIIDNHVSISKTAEFVRHKVILNYRGLLPISDLKQELNGVDYAEHYPFIYAEGSDRRASLEASLAKKLLHKSCGECSAHFGPNPGRSDASAIWNATTAREQLEILTMGPGTRSHTDNGISRRTHGPDEGFHKESGYIAVQFICDFISSYLSVG